MRVRAAISEKRFSFEVMVRLFPGFAFVSIAWSSYYDHTMNCPGRGFAPHAGPSGTARMISPRESTPWAVCVKRQRADVLLSQKSGSPEDTELERISLGGPRIKHLRDLFVIESGAQSR